MKKTSRILLSTALLGILGMVSVSSQALVKWNFVTANCVSNGCSNDSRTFDAFSTTAGENPDTVTATGWANTNPGATNNRLEKGQVQQFGGGIGVVNGDAGLSGNPEDTNSGEHSVDNIGRYDLVLFAFEDSVSVSEVGIGWYSGDADISLLAWNGSGDPSNLTDVFYSDVGAEVNGPDGLVGKGWELIGNYDVDNTVDPDPDAQGNSDDRVADVSNSKSSSYWIVAAYNNVFGGNHSQNNDKFKIFSLAGTIDTTTTTTSVPAPASLLLLLCGIVPILRRRRRND